MAETGQIEELERRIMSLMRAERWLDAAKLLRSELPLVQQEWRLSWNLGWCYFKLERLIMARQYLIRATTLAPNNPVCKWALGDVYLYLNQFKKAQALFEQSLRIKESYIARLLLALALLKQGKIIEAEDVHLEAIRLRPKRSSVYEDYAAFLFDVGREADATRMTRKAKKLQRVN